MVSVIINFFPSVKGSVFSSWSKALLQYKKFLTTVLSHNKITVEDHSVMKIFNKPHVLNETLNENFH